MLCTVVAYIDVNSSFFFFSLIKIVNDSCSRRGKRGFNLFTDDEVCCCKAACDWLMRDNECDWLLLFCP